MRVSVIGAAGYIGGDLVRLLLSHEDVTLSQVTSDRLAGRPLAAAHPNLRGQSDLIFCRHREVTPADLLFVAAPPGAAHAMIDDLMPLAPRIIDLSPDFRLEGDVRQRIYGLQPRKLPVDFVPGIPELYRGRLREATHVSVPGCMATAAILALQPIARASLIEPDVAVDGRTGSSGSGGRPTRAGQHAERRGTMRIYEPFGHRHHAEIDRHCGVRSRMSATAVEAVRGVQVLVRARAKQALSHGDLASAYRDAYRDEPFVRVLNSPRQGLPDPRVLTGSNFCDIGFAVDDEEDTGIVLAAALDNLVKGGAGNAVQCMNIGAGLPERTGLGFPGLYPV